MGSGEMKRNAGMVAAATVVGAGLVRLAQNWQQIPKIQRTGDSSEATFRGGKSSQRLIIVLNQLPITGSHENGRYHFEWDKDALLQQAQENMTEYELIFIGQLPLVVPGPEQAAVRERLVAEFGCVPVFLDPQVKDMFYLRMCKQILWPLFHYVVPISPLSDGRFNPTYWDAYQTANQMFADTVKEVIRSNEDLVWVNDYHLCLVPTLVRTEHHSVKCGFFLHCVFPSSELFRAFPRRMEILTGILNADLVGFHSFQHARHFLSCCSRMLGVEFQSNKGTIELQYLGRTVKIIIRPAGTHVTRLKEVMQTPECLGRREALEERYRGKTVLVGVDDVDEFKGIGLKFQALKTMLIQHPELVGLVYMIQVANPARNKTLEVERMQEEMRQWAEDINQTFDYPMVEVWERPVPPPERAALYSVAAVCISTALRGNLVMLASNAMNLVPYEYIVCRQHLPPTDQAGPAHSALVVSEFVGLSDSLSGAVRVNPWDVDGTADAIYSALTMEFVKRITTHQAHYKFIQRHTVGYWANGFAKSLGRTREGPRMQRTTSVGLGSGLAFRVAAVQSHMQHLGAAALCRAVAAAQRCVFLLDYDGTLTFEKNCSLPIPPSEQVLQALRGISQAPGGRHSVCIVSGRGRATLAEWFASTPLVGVAAEQGRFYRARASAAWSHNEGAGGRGHAAMMGEVAQWKAAVLPIIEPFVEQTEGSHVQDKETSIAWHFHESDPSLGAFQAQELVPLLKHALQGHHVEVNVGSSVVEVRPTGMNKGIAAKRVVDDIIREENRVPDLLLCIGDEKSDEAMFAVLGDLKEEYGEHISAFACTVGQKTDYTSAAGYYLNDPSEVGQLLNSIAELESAPKDSTGGRGILGAARKSVDLVRKSFDRRGGR